MHVVMGLLYISRLTWAVHTHKKSFMFLIIVILTSTTLNKILLESIKSSDIS